MIYEFQKNEYSISTDKAKLQFDVIHGFLSTSYWSPNVPMEIVKRAAENCLAFGIYKHPLPIGEGWGDRRFGGVYQVGYARIISDYTTFAYLADVFVLESERGKGLSKWLMECIMQVPDLQGLRRWMLATRDAHGLYAQFGFTPLDNPSIMMQIARPNIYNEEQSN